ncbi:MAG: tRNA(His) guanylyltransferase Thg1 family protein [bacterium]
MSKPEKDSLGDRMKGYEDAFRIYLPKRLPLIIRVDGKAFHTFTRNLNKPFDYDFIDVMLFTAIKLCEEIQGVKLAYWQSDEISLFITDYDTLTTQAPFDKNLQKLVSISASIATSSFNQRTESIELSRFEHGINEYKFKSVGNFDSRAFILPKEEVCNYFLWRQQDATRNSINSVGQANFSDRVLHGQNVDQVQELLFKEKGINWNDLPVLEKRGACVVKNAEGRWDVDRDIPIFSQDREYVNKFVNIGD